MRYLSEVIWSEKSKLIFEPRSVWSKACAPFTITKNQLTQKLSQISENTKERLEKNL